jgi:hypothetical protein
VTNSEQVRAPPRRVPEDCRTEDAGDSGPGIGARVGLTSKPPVIRPTRAQRAHFSRGTEHPIVSLASAFTERQACHLIAKRQCHRWSRLGDNFPL